MSSENNCFCFQIFVYLRIYCTQWHCYFWREQLSLTLKYNAKIDMWFLYMTLWRWLAPLPDPMALMISSKYPPYIAEIPLTVTRRNDLCAKGYKEWENDSKPMKGLHSDWVVMYFTPLLIANEEQKVNSVRKCTPIKIRLNYLYGPYVW